MSNRLGGGAMNRQVSASHVHTRNNEGFHEFFSKSSDKIEGLLHIRNDQSSRWEQSLVSFEHGTVFNFVYAEVKTQIFMNDVISFRIDSKFDGFSWLMTYRTPKKATMYFRVETKEKMNDWLFAYQKATALVLSALMASSKANDDLSKRISLDDMWRSEGEDRLRKHRHDFEAEEGGPLYHIHSTNTRASTTDDVVEVRPAGRWEHVDHKSVLNLQALSQPYPIASPARPSQRGSTPSAAATPDNVTYSCSNLQRVHHTPRVGTKGSRSNSEGLLVLVGGRQREDSDLASDSGIGLAFPSTDDDLDSLPFHMEGDDDVPHRTHLRRGSSTSSHGAAEISLKVSGGACTKKGPRDYQEDRFVAISDLDDVLGASGQLSGTSSYSYFAVYDGHSGAEASSYLESQLHSMICTHRLFLTDIQTAISESCIIADKLFLDICRNTRRFAGTTAIGAFLVGSKLTVYSVGDCQALLCRADKPLELLSPHKPNRQDELTRITAANGWITEEKELFMGRLHRMDLSDNRVVEEAKKVTWVINHRVCGELAVSRSIGDPDYKSFTPGEVVTAPFLWPKDHNQIFYADLVIPNPDCITVEISKKDAFLILASDGLWDVISFDDAILYSKASFSKGRTAAEAAEDLCDLALRLGSGDNVTVVIVVFMHDDETSLTDGGVSLL